MAIENTQATSQLVRGLKLRDLVLFNLAAVLGLRHLGTSSKAGPATLLLWLLAAFFFFIPQGLAVIELSSRFPNSGGIYDWTKRALGEGHGYICGWCYWINNVLYYPNLLISAAVIATFAVGKSNTGLKDDLVYVTITTLVCLWMAVAVNIVGVGPGKWLQNLGGLGSYVPGALVIIAGLYAWLTRPAANTITMHDLLPRSTDYDSLNLWISIAFAYAGLELSATMGDEVENPRRNLPLSVYISAPLIAFIYILGTGSVLWLIPRDNINVVAGFLQAIETGMSQISPSLTWLVPLSAVLYTLGSIGGVGAWMTAPARVAFAIGLDRYFPPAFGRIHPTWRTPYVAILVQAILATVLLLIFVLLGNSTVGKVYLILLSAQLIIYFIPYIYLFVVFVIHRRRDGVRADIMTAPGGMVGAYFLAFSGIAVTVFAIILAFVPPPGTANTLEYELKAGGGVAALLLLGGILYWRAKFKRG